MFKRFKALLSLLLILALLAPSLLLAPSHAEAKRTYVDGYTRKDGTRVKGHWRDTGSNSSSSSSSSSNYSNSNYYDNSYPNNNYSTPSKGIVNLYKGSTIVGSTSTNDLVFVQGYYRQDGTYVRPHYRTHPNQFLSDNFSYQGVSTLFPLDKPFSKYPTYVPSSSFDNRAIENYLGYQVMRETLSNDQVISLQNYAQFLVNSTQNQGSKDIALAYGKTYYASLGIAPEIGDNLAYFDVTAELTPSVYISQVLYSYGVKTLKEEMIPVFHAYATALQAAQGTVNAEVYSKKAQKLGYTLYYGTDQLYADISTQLELDKLQSVQTFKISPNQDALIAEINNQWVGRYQNTFNDIDRYMEDVTHISRKDSLGDARLTSYKVQLFVLNAGSSFFSTRDNYGVKYYQSIGWSKEQSEAQVVKDFLVFL